MHKRKLADEDPLDKLFVDKTREQLIAKGYRVKGSDNEWFVFKPNGQTIGNWPRFTKLFRSEEQAWEAAGLDDAKG